MAQIEKRIGAGNDPDAFFVCIRHSDTAEVIQHLRENRIKFSVDVEPDPPEDQSDDDIFWFESSAEIDRIQSIINDVTKN